MAPPLGFENIAQAIAAAVPTAISTTASTALIVTPAATSLALRLSPELSIRKSKAAASLDFFALIPGKALCDASTAIVCAARCRDP